MNPYMIPFGFGFGAKPIDHFSHSTCNNCSRFRSMAVRKCDKKHNVKGDTIACKHLLYRSEKGFR